MFVFFFAEGLQERLRGCVVEEGLVEEAGGGGRGRVQHEGWGREEGGRGGDQGGGEGGHLVDEEGGADHGQHTRRVGGQTDSGNLEKT